jgi:hypothetical protein
VSRGFRAEPEAIVRLAAGLERVADQLAREADAFSSSTRGVAAGAFGLAPSADHAHRAYARAAEDAHAGLRAVHGTLHGDVAGGLRAVAGNYRTADEDASWRR